MLSKLKHDGPKVRESSMKEVASIMADLQSAFGADLTELRPIEGGTLGLCFAGRLRGTVRFFKSHVLPSGCATLVREREFLQITAPSINPELVALSGGRESERLWLHLAWLERSSDVVPSSVRAVVKSYEDSLVSNNEAAKLVPRTDDLCHLVSEARLALEVLSEDGFLTSAIRQRALQCINRAAEIGARHPACLCHGDLSPANILTDGKALIALDWEDVFWGVSGYDYLYWLTFFSNRKWLLPESLGHTALTRSEEVSLMIVVLILKSFISVRNGQHKHNSLSVDQRLSEVLNLE